MAAAVLRRGVPVTPAAPAATPFVTKFTASNSSSILQAIRPCCNSPIDVSGGCSVSISGSGGRRLLGGGVRTHMQLHIARASLQPPEAGTEQAEEQGSRISREIDGTVAKQRSTSPPMKNELNEAVRKTAATFAPRASVASKNPAPPGSTLYKVFETQAYIAMVVGGALSFNLLFPSDHPDLWRLMGMWSVWMFTVPSLRARDCSKKEKEALNYLFLAIPLINVTLPLVWKSFGAVWSADVLAFIAIYAWKLEWLSAANKAEDS